MTVHAVEQRVQLTLRVTERVRLALPYVMASAFVAVFLNSIGAGAVAFLGWYVGAAVGRHVLRGE